MPATAPAAVANPLAHWRSEFPIFERTVYLNSCSLGALSRAARARVEGVLDQWAARGAANWYDTWWAALEELRNRYGAVVNARPGEIALHPSVSSILGIIGSILLVLAIIAVVVIIIVAASGGFDESYSDY